jgi:hypothetical protein
MCHKYLNKTSPKPEGSRSLTEREQLQLEKHACRYHMALTSSLDYRRALAGEACEAINASVQVQPETPQPTRLSLDTVTSPFAANPRALPAIMYLRLDRHTVGWVEVAEQAENKSRLV